MSAAGYLLAYKESTDAIGKAIHALLTSGVFWTAVGVLVTLAIALASGLFALYRHLDGKIERSFDARLDAKLRTPSFALESLEATERAASARVQDAERRVEELKQERNTALRENDQEHARTLAERLKELETLRTRFEAAETERARLSQELENAISSPKPQPSGSGVSLPNGYILVVRHAGKFGALQAVEQRTHDYGIRPFIRYAWWYQPDGSGTFTRPSTQRGFGEAEEPHTLEQLEASSQQNTPLRVDRWPVLQIGPIPLEWSIARDGMGYVYFGPPFHHSDEYELAITNELDITNVDGSRLKFFRQSEPS